MRALRRHQHTAIPNFFFFFFSKEELLTLYEQTGEYEHWLMRHVYLVLGGELTGAQDASSPAKKTQISTMKTLTLSGERQSSSRGSSKGPVFVVI